VLTRQDRVVSPRRQRLFVDGIAGASLRVVEGDHGIVAFQPGRFVPALVDAVRDVTARARTLARAPR